MSCDNLTKKDFIKILEEAGFTYSIDKVDKAFELLIKKINPEQHIDEEAKAIYAGIVDECRRLKSNGQNLTAAKYYRDKVGTSLREAFDFVLGPNC